MAGCVARVSASLAVVLILVATASCVPVLGDDDGADDDGGRVDEFTVLNRGPCANPRGASGSNCKAAYLTLYIGGDERDVVLPMACVRISRLGTVLPQIAPVPVYGDDLEKPTGRTERRVVAIRDGRFVWGEVPTYEQKVVRVDRYRCR